MTSGTNKQAWWREAWVSALVITLFALAWRISTFGNPTLHIDDEFYVLVGQRMHEGLLPYVDIWDRKPPGLFLIYYAIAAISYSPEAYQITAWLFASATGFVICLCGRRIAGGTGGVFAGLLYIAGLHISGGNGGQAPVFYNLFVALSAYLLLMWMDGQARRPDRKVWFAMALLGIALTIKQTVMFEAAFMGCFVLWQLWQNGERWPVLARTAVVSAALGCLPTALCFAWFAAVGHFDIFWHAMIASNAAKAYPDFSVMGARALLLLIEMLPLAAPALLALVGMDKRMGQYGGRFAAGWLVVAVLALLAVPNFYQHYFLPVWVPVCVLASGFLQRRWMGPAAGLACIAYSALYASPFNFEWTRVSKQDFEELSDLMQSLPGDDLLVLEGPIALYGRTSRQTVSPLVFPNHLNQLAESDVSHLETLDEVDRLLGRRPSVIIMTIRPRNEPPNASVWGAVRSYVKRCERAGRLPVKDSYWRLEVEVFACGNEASVPVRHR